MGLKNQEEAWVGITRVADYFSISRQTVYRWIEKREIPYHKVGNLLRFKISEIDHWARANQPKRTPKEKQINLLLVEDDPHDVVVTKRLLKSKNYDITVAGNGEEALGMLKDLQPDLIFLDLQLPLIDGVSVLKEIKNQKMLSDIPVVCITGFDKYLKKVLNLSPITILSKPLTEEKIQEALKLALHQMVKR